MTALKSEEKLPRNIAKAALSSEKSTPMIDLGFLMIFFRPNINDTPALMRYPRVNESQKDWMTDYTQPSLCLQCSVF